MPSSSRISVLVMILMALAPCLAAFGISRSTFMTPTEVQPEATNPMRLEFGGGGSSSYLQFDFHAGLNMYDISGTVIYDGAVNTALGQLDLPATPLSVQDDLEMEGSQSPSFGFQANLLGFIRLQAHYTPGFKLEGQATRSYDITFGGVNFIADNQVDSLIEGDFVSAELGFVVLPFASTLGFEAGAGIGVHGLTNFHMEATGTINVQPGNQTETRTEEAPDLPFVGIPAVMVFVNVFPTDSIGLEATVHYLKTPDLSDAAGDDFNKLEGSAIHAAFTAKYYAFENLGIGARLGFLSTSVSVEYDDGTDELITEDLTFDNIEFSLVLALSFF